ncbi:hypothetical protein [Actinocrinis sp.]|uniref:hypothetical protein n=1 Tax=Actinocrinis sp. TaxID=1920516 RepID=UPI002D26D4B6|nr:hypothetical protein [Actinocrinis sp.]HZP51785.1 hypothetical protein [Actinocrinis sp.]
MLDRPTGENCAEAESSPTVLQSRTAENEHVGFKAHHLVTQVIADLSALRVEDHLRDVAKIGTVAVHDSEHVSRL